LTCDIKNLFNNAHSYVEYYAKVHYNLFTEYGDNARASREIDNKGRKDDARTSGRTTQRHEPPAACCWRRRRI